MANSMWVVTLLYFLLANLINHVSSGHNQQNVGDITLFLARHFHQSCIFPSPTESESHCFISLPGSLINHVSSHDQQYVSDNALFFTRQSHQSCLITGSEWHYFISSIMSHPMTNRQWVTLWLYLQSHQSCLIPWSTGCEWHCSISSLINCVSSHDQQGVSGTALFHQLCLTHLANRQWVTMFCFLSIKSYPLTTR